MSIHSSAVVHSTAQIGANVTIGPFVVIGPETHIADNCHIVSNAVIEYTELGEGCVVYPQVSLGLAPQHLGYKNEKTKLVIGKKCTFREGVTVHRGTMLDKGITRIGANGFFMAFSHIAHDCVIGDDVIFANGAQMAGHVEIGDKCFVSTLVGVHQRVRVGQSALISGGAMVPLDVPPFAIAQGDRAFLRGLNLVGIKRAGIDRESIKLIKEAYQVVFYSGLILSEALMDPIFQSNNQHVLTLKKFLSEPKRGFLRPSSGVGKGEKVEELLT